MAPRLPKVNERTKLGAVDACNWVGDALTAESSTGLARRFKILADPARVRMLSLISAHPSGEVCVCDLACAFDLSQPTISHHLRVLRDAGFVDSTRRGTWVYYRLTEEGARLVSMLNLVAPSHEARSPGREQRAEPTGRRVAKAG